MNTDEQLDLVENCLAALGKPNFLESYLALIESTGAIRTNIYSCETDRPICLLIGSFDKTPVGELATAIYLSGWYKYDPMLAEVRNLKPNMLTIRHLKGMPDVYPQDYIDAFQKIRKRYTHQVNVTNKTSVLAVSAKFKLIVNLYFPEIHTPKADETLLSILARLALQHFEAKAHNSQDYPEVLSCLSDRERQVCMGILAGKKAERIADEIEVAPSTVVTYRRRAYEKLGISSRASLFDICKS